MKKEIDDKKWRLFDLALHVVVSMISTFGAEVVTARYFNNSFGLGMLFCIIFIIILMPIYQFVMAVVEESKFLRKPFEKKER